MVDLTLTGTDKAECSIALLALDHTDAHSRNEEDKHWEADTKTTNQHEGGNNFMTKRIGLGGEFG